MTNCQEFSFPFEQFSHKYQNEFVQFAIKKLESSPINSDNFHSHVAEVYGYIDYLRIGLELNRAAIKVLRHPVLKVLNNFEHSIRAYKLTDRRVVSILLKNFHHCINFSTLLMSKNFTVLKPYFLNPYEDLRRFSVGEKPNKVVLFTNNIYSPVTVELLSQLRDLSVPISVLYAPHSLKKPFSRKLYHFIRKKINLFFSKRSVKYLDEIHKNMGIPRSVMTACQLYGADFHKVENFNFDCVQTVFGSCSDALAVFAGSSILPRKTLQFFRGAVLHAHPGVLPYMRGLETIEWPLVNRSPEFIGYTVQYMNAGLDSGAILEICNSYKISSLSLAELRSQIQYDAVCSLCSSVKNVIKNGFLPAKIPKYLHPTSFVMSPLLFLTATTSLDP